MDNYIKIDREHHVEDCLVTIILEPDYFGFVDVRSQKDLVIEKLLDMANYQAESPFSSDQAAKVYDRIMAGDIEQTIRDYFTRNLAYCHCAITTLYHRITDITHQSHLHQNRTRSKEAAQTALDMTRPQELFENIVEEFEKAMLDLKDLSNLFADTTVQKKP